MLDDGIFPQQSFLRILEQIRDLMGYKDIVLEITRLPWQDALPQEIILVSHCTAKEFATSLRLAQKLYPDDDRVREMIDGELETDNMVFEDYQKRGDHWEFLDHFIAKHSIASDRTALKNAIEVYTSAVDGLSDIHRAMTIFSREEELTLIFQRLVTAHD
jgi:hypothetical protein